MPIDRTKLPPLPPKKTFLTQVGEALPKVEELAKRAGGAMLRVAQKPIEDYIPGVPEVKQQFNKATSPETFHKVSNTPVSDFIPGGREFREKLAQPGLREADQQTMAELQDKPEFRNKIPVQLEQRVDTRNPPAPVKAGEEGGWVSQLGRSARDFAVDASKIPFSEARQKGFVSGALEGLNPKTLAQALAVFASGGGAAAAKLYGLSANAISALDDAYSTTDKSLPTPQRVASAFGLLAGAAGMAHGGADEAASIMKRGPGVSGEPVVPKPVAPAAPVEPVVAKPVAPKPAGPIRVASTDDALAALDRLNKAGRPAVPGSPESAQVVADHELLSNHTLKSPGGRAALRIAKGGRPDVVRGEEQRPPVGDYEVMAAKAEQENAARIAAEQAKEFKATQSDAAADLQVKEGQIKKIQDDAKLSAKEKADQIKSLNEGFKANADATQGLAKAEAVNEKVVGKAQGQAGIENTKRDQAIARQQKIEDFKNRADVEGGEPTLSESVQGEGPIGEKEALKKTYRVKPEDEEGGPEGSGDEGGGGPVLAPKGPVNDHFTFKDAKAEVARRGGDASTHDIKKMGPGHFQVQERVGQPPVVGEPPVEGGAAVPEGPAPVEPKGPAPAAPVDDFSDVGAEAMRKRYHGKVWKNQSTAQEIADLYNMDVRRAGPRGRWETYDRSQTPEFIASVRGGQPAPITTEDSPITKWANGGPTPAEQARAAAAEVPAEPDVYTDADHARLNELNDKFTREGDLTPEEHAEYGVLDRKHSAAIAGQPPVDEAAASAPEEAQAAPFVNDKGEAQDVLPGVNPVQNATPAVAEAPFALERTSAKVAKAKESVNPLFEAQMDDLHPDEGTAATTAPKIIPTGNGTLPAEPDLPMQAEMPSLTPQEIVADIKSNQAGVKGGRKKSALGDFAKQLGKQAEGAEPLAVPESLAGPPELADPDNPLNAMPKGRLREIAQGNEGGTTKDQLLQDNGMKQAAPPKAAPLRVAPEPPAQEPLAPAPAAQVEGEGAPTVASPEAEPTLEQMLSELPPEEQTPAIINRIKKFLANQGGGGGGMTGQGGFATTDLMRRIAMGTLGAGAGAYYDPADDKTTSAVGGGLLGAFAPDLLRGLEKLYVSGAIKGTNPALKSLDIANKAHNTGLLSPLSVFKKFGGDVGGLSLAALENPERAADMARQFTSGQGLRNLKANFAEGFKGPELEEAGTGLENFFQGPVLGFNGRMMGGLTKATKGVMGESGFTPAEQAYYTLTSKPKYPVTKSLYSFLRGSGSGASEGQGGYGSRLLQHLSPFARIGINRLERGWEYSPLGLLNTVGKTGDTEALQKIFTKAAIGTGVGGSAYAMTPEDFVKDHPVAASNLAAMAGPLGIPVIAAMAMKTRHDDPNDTSLDVSKKMARASAAIGRDIPGLRLMEDLTGRGFPEGFGRNYLAGYTNITRPAALLYDQLRGVTDEPDVSSQDLPMKQRYFNRMISNLPGPLGRDWLPKKNGGSGTSESLLNPPDEDVPIAPSFFLKK